MIESNPKAPGRAWLLAPVLALLTFLVFAPALQNDFVNWDDDKNFLANEHYRGLGPSELHWMWTSHLLGRYIPITWMTFGVDYLVWGMEPMGYHLTSLLWHCANAVLFYFLALALLRRAIPADSPTAGRLPLGAFFAALVFAVHPLRVESVVWITERRDVVSGFFYLLAILAYLRAADRAPAQRLDRKYYWVCFGCFVLAVLSKEIAVTLPVVLWALDYYPLRRLGGKQAWLGAAAWPVWLEKIPFFVVSLADSALALWAGKEDRLTTSLANIGWVSRAGITFYALAFYLWKSVWPVHLGPFYALLKSRVDPRGLPFQLSAILVLWITAAVFLFRRKSPALVVAALMYLVTLLPVSGVFQNGMQIAADRYTYLPCLGWAILAGACLIAAWQRWGRLPAARAAIATGAAAIVVVFGLLTWRQSETWHDSETLWTHALSVEPSFIAYNNLGMYLSEKGDPLAAIDNFHKSIQMNPDYEFSHNNLGGSLLDIRKWDEAAREFELALRIQPDLPTSQNGWGYALLMQGRVDEAIQHFQLALQMDPAYDSARRNLDRARAMKNQPSGS